MEYPRIHSHILENSGIDMIKLSWEDIERAAKELGEKITASGFAPEYIVGITTGGLIPLGFLTKQLGIRNILTVSAQSYEKDTQKELAVTYLPNVDLRGKTVLLVDEISDTGVTLRSIADTLRKKYAAKEVKSAVLVVNGERCLSRPDFFVREEREWVVFPWEREEFPEYFR